MNRIDGVIRTHDSLVHKFIQDKNTCNPKSPGSIPIRRGQYVNSILAKFAKAVRRLCDSSASAVVVVNPLNVPKRVCTTKW